VSGGTFDEVDVDLLADYVGGALDGTPDETAVAQLVTEVPAWRAAHAELVAAMAAVVGDLRAYGAAPEPMPDDIAEHLTVALADAPRPDAAQAPDPLSDAVTTAADLPAPDAARPDGGLAGTPRTDTVPAGPGSGEAAQADPSRGRHLVSVPGDRPSGRRTSGGAGPRSSHDAGRPRSRDAGRRTSRDAGRRWMRRWAAPIAAAAGVLAFAGFGVNALRDGPDSRQESSTAGQADVLGAQDSGAPSVNAPEAAAGDALAASQILTSGSDYRRDALAARPGVPFRKPGDKAGMPPTVAADPPGERVASDAAIDPSLRRLSDREALLACLDAIAKVHGSGTIGVQTVDFARFEGSPALVIRFTAGGQEWSWVSGPQCGTPTLEADTRFRVQVR
jgi:hypothetical protein